MSEDRRLELRVSQGLLDRLDAVRGELPRGSFVKRALEKALGDAVERPVAGSHPGLAPSPVKDATDWARDRQARLNKAKGM